MPATMVAARRLSTSGGVTLEWLWDTSSRGQSWFRSLCPCRIPHMPGCCDALHASYRWSRGESFHTFRTFVAVHQGDYFRTLADYRRFMMKQGFQAAAAPDNAFGAIWCAWGYGRSVQPQQVYDTLPTVKRLGFVWVTLDDGWQNNVGDWALDPKKFPRGDADIKALVDRIHQEGFRAQLWWSPLSAVPDSELLRDHPDYELLNRDGSKEKSFLVELLLFVPGGSPRRGVPQGIGA